MPSADAMASRSRSRSRSPAEEKEARSPLSSGYGYTSSRTPPLPLTLRPLLPSPSSPPKPHDNSRPFSISSMSMSSSTTTNNKGIISSKGGVRHANDGRHRSWTAKIENGEMEGNRVMLALPIADIGLEVPSDDEWVYGYTLLERAKARTQKQRPDAARPMRSLPVDFPPPTRISPGAVENAEPRPRSPPRREPASLDADAYGRALLERAKRWRNQNPARQHRGEGRGDK